MKAKLALIIETIPAVFAQSMNTLSLHMLFLESSFEKDKNNAPTIVYIITRTISLGIFFFIFCESINAYILSFI